MIKKRIYILDGHPALESLSKTFSQAYANTARKAGHEVRITHLHDIDFDIDHGYAGYSQSKPLESVLEKVLEDIEWSEHLVLTTPMWWGGLPAKLKGLFDRAFQPGRVFDRENTKAGMPLPMLIGRTARLILTSDTPSWFLRIAYRNAIFHQLRGQIFGFVGIKPLRITHFSAASHASKDTIKQWIKKVEKIAIEGK